MKVCSECKAYNSDERSFCVDCGEKLGYSISKFEEGIISEKISETTESLYNDNDPLYVSAFDKIIGITSIVGLLIMIVLCIVSFFRHQTVSFALLSFIFFGISAFVALCPQIDWAIEKHRLSFTISNPDDAEPSDFYKFSRKFSETVLCILGIAVIILMIISLSKPPVIKYIDKIANDLDSQIYSYTLSGIKENPELWEKIISGGDYSVEQLLEELESSNTTGIREQLMIAAIIEIENIDNDFYYTDKADFLAKYYLYKAEEHPDIKVPHQTNH